jgi:hypothetical protein
MNFYPCLSASHSAFCFYVIGNKSMFICVHLCPNQKMSQILIRVHPRPIMIFLPIQAIIPHSVCCNRFQFAIVVHLLNATDNAVVSLIVSSSAFRSREQRSWAMFRVIL